MRAQDSAIGASATVNGLSVTLESAQAYDEYPDLTREYGGRFLETVWTYHNQGTAPRPLTDPIAVCGDVRCEANHVSFVAVASHVPPGQSQRLPCVFEIPLDTEKCLLIMDDEMDIIHAWGIEIESASVATRP